jgi:hypothetical protein
MLYCIYLGKSYYVGLSSDSVFVKIARYDLDVTHRRHVCNYLLTNSTVLNSFLWVCLWSLSVCLCLAPMVR